MVRRLYPESILAHCVLDHPRYNKDLRVELRLRRPQRWARKFLWRIMRHHLAKSGKGTEANRQKL